MDHSGCGRGLLRGGVVPDVVSLHFPYAVGDPHVAVGCLGHGALLQGKLC